MDRTTIETLSEMKIYFKKILTLYYSLEENILPQDQEIDVLCRISLEEIERKLKESGVGDECNN